MKIVWVVEFVPITFCIFVEELIFSGNKCVRINNDLFHFCSNSWRLVEQTTRLSDLGLGFSMFSDVGNHASNYYFVIHLALMRLLSKVSN